MRRIRNHKAISNNPGLMFAAGIEQIINDTLFHPPQFDDQELLKIQNIAIKQALRDNPFKFLFRQFAY